jgi:hypothetical protein
MNELCFNLWYYLDGQQRITGIAAKAYTLQGSDEEKGAFLLSASRTDYHSIAPSSVAPVHYSALMRLGIEVFFAKEFDRIACDTPVGVALPEEKLYCATPLFDFGGGFVPARIGDGFICERD